MILITGTSLASGPSLWRRAMKRALVVTIMLAASVPLALAEGIADSRIKRGDLLLLEAMGGGFTWGAALVRW